MNIYFKYDIVIHGGNPAFQNQVTVLRDAYFDLTSLNLLLEYLSYGAAAMH